MMLDDADTPKNVLVWSKDAEGGYHTHLLNGNKNHTQRIASVPELLLATTNSVYRLEQNTEQIVLCDCDKWQETNYEDECPAALQTADVSKLQLVPLTMTNDGVASETTKELELFPSDLEETHSGEMTSFRQKVEVTGNIGPFVFVRYERDAAVCNDEKINESGTLIFNLETQRVEPLLLEEELRRVEENEKKEAAQTISETTGFSHISESDLQLTEIKPVFFYGLGSSIGFQFEAESQMASSENNWKSYTKAVTVQAREIPKKLTPYVIAPTVVRNLTLSENVIIGGWMPVEGTATKVQSLLIELLNARINSENTAD